MTIAQGGRVHLHTRFLLAAISVAAVGVAVAGSARAASLTSIDYFTETTGNAAMEKLLKACTEKTGITIDRQAVPDPQLVQKVLLAATSQSLPDLIMMDNSDVATLADGGIIVSLTDVGVDTSAFTPSLVAIGNYKGKNYSLQTAVNTLALWYNKDMLSKAGVKPPTTWEELKADAKKLTGKDVYGLVFPAVATEEGTFHASPFIWSNGGDFQTLNSPENVEALKYLAGFITDGSVSKSAVTWSGDDANDQFAAGRAAMSIGGSWHIPQNSQVKGLNYGIVVIPTPKAGQQVKVPVGGEVWAVSATADKATAKTYLNCLGSDPMVLQWAEDRNYVPGKPAVLDEYKKAVPSMAPFISSTAGAVSRTSVLGTAYPKYSAAFSAALQAVPYPQLVEKVQQAASSNSLPDLMLMDNSDAAQFAAGGSIVPITTVGVNLKGFTPSIIEVGAYKGKDYTMQAGVNTLALWYNTDLFKAAASTIRRRPGTSSGPTPSRSPAKASTASPSLLWQPRKGRSMPRPSSGRTSAISSRSIHRRMSRR